MLAFLAAVAGTGIGWAADDASVTLKVFPEETTLTPGSTVSGTLVVSNATDREVYVSLDAQASDPSMDVDLTSPMVEVTEHGWLT